MGRVHFDADKWNDEDTKKFFRFRKADMEELKSALNIPNVIRTHKGDRFDGMEALYALRYRLSYKCTWERIQTELGGRCRTSYERVFYWMVDHVYDSFGHVLCDMTRVAPYARDLASAACVKGCPYATCIGFIDGTFRPIARPTGGEDIVAGGFQFATYNAYYSGHGLKHQGVVLTNGLLGHLSTSVLRVLAMTRTCSASRRSVRRLTLSSELQGPTISYTATLLMP